MSLKKLSRVFPMLLFGVSLLPLVSIVHASETWPVFKIIDLTHPLHPDIPRWPGSPPFEMAPLTTIEKDGYYLNRICLTEHFGTHVDAPIHFQANAQDTAGIRLQQLVVPAVVIDVRQIVKGDPDYILSLDAIHAWEEQHGPFPKSAAVLLATEWSSRWPSEERYRNIDKSGTMHFPGFSADAIKYLIEKYNISVLGIDTLSLDPGISKDFAAHHMAASHGILVIENLDRPERLPPRGSLLFIGVLPIKQGSGSPVRVLALVPENPQP